MEKLIPFSSWIHNWTFIQGVPKEGWQNCRQEGRNFHLDACINLDRLCDTPPVPNESEAVLYCDFATETEGTVMIGMGCDWRMKVYCDGDVILDTWESGNGYSYIFPSNHRVFFHVKAGSHLLAFHVKRGQDSWYFTCGGVSQEPPPEPELTHGPWLSNPDVGTMTVAFTCANPLGAAIQYRKIGTDDWKTTWHQRQGQCLRRTYHAIPLTNLEPGAKYEYRIIVIHPDHYTEMQLGDTHSFVVPDVAKSKYSFFFTADLQFNLEKQHQIFGKMLEAADAKSCDFFVLAGDVNSGFLPENVIGGPFAQLCEYGTAEKPILYVRGNHEMRGTYGDQFLDYFACGNGTSYDVVRLGDTAFLLLDSWEDKPAKTPGHTYCQWNMDELFWQQETEWLATAMADEKWTGAKRRIVICHGAAYSHYDGCMTIPFVLQKMTDPYFEGANPVSKLNMWLTGHIHRYLRSIPGTDDYAAERQPIRPFKGGKTYTYPVLTVGGPSSLNIKASCFRVDADADGFDVKSWDQDGNLLEDLRYDNDGTCTERKAFEHYTVEPINP